MSEQVGSNLSGVQHENYKSISAQDKEADISEIPLDEDTGNESKSNTNDSNGNEHLSLSTLPVEDNTEEETFTVEQAMDRIGFGRFQVKLSMLTGLAWMADAMEMMILSILSPALHCAWGISNLSQALITTVVFVGMMISSSAWGTFADRFGRKAELIACSFVTFYFGLLSAFSPSLIWMFILRGLTGFGIGGAPQSITLYAEFLPTASRAKCIVLVEVFWAIGTCFEVLLALIIMPTLGWRWLLAFSAVPLLIFICCCLWLPESARYDATRGHHDKAMKTIQRIAKENNKPMLLGKLVEHSHQNVKRGRIKDLFTPEYRMTTILLWITWFASAFSYYGVVLMATELLEVSDGAGCPSSTDVAEPGCRLECKVLSTTDYGFLLWTTLAEFPGLLITLFVIEKIGRKKTMCAEFVAFSVFVGLVAVCASRPVTITFVFIARAFITGAFQAAYVYTPEVYPTSVRALGLGTCSGAARVGAIVTPFVAQVLLEYSVYATVAVYSSVCLMAAVSSILLPIETKGRAMKDTTH